MLTPSLLSLPATGEEAVAAGTAEAAGARLDSPGGPAATAAARDPNEDATVITLGVPGSLEVAGSPPNKPLPLLLCALPPSFFVPPFSGVARGAAAAAVAPAEVGWPNNAGTAGVDAEPNKPPAPLPNPLELLPPTPWAEALPPNPAGTEAPEDRPHGKEDRTPVAVAAAAASAVAPVPKIDPVVVDGSPRFDGLPKRGAEAGGVEALGAAARCTSVPSSLSCPQRAMTTCSVALSGRRTRENGTIRAGDGERYTLARARQTRCEAPTDCGRQMQTHQHKTPPQERARELVHVCPKEAKSRVGGGERETEKGKL